MRWRTFTAAALFVGGALGGEVLGVIMWIHTLLRCLAEHYGELRLRFGSPRGD